jgi:hypothetical protein
LGDRSREDEGRIELEILGPTRAEELAAMEARVQETAGEVNREIEPVDPPETPPEAPLELAERPPKPKPAPFVAPAERDLFRRRLRLTAVVLVMIALGGALSIYFARKGEKGLPPVIREQLEDLKPGLYTYSDDEGVVHIVDEWKKVPERFRARAVKKGE